MLAAKSLTDGDPWFTDDGVRASTMVETRTGTVPLDSVSDADLASLVEGSLPQLQAILDNYSQREHYKCQSRGGERFRYRPDDPWMSKDVATDWQTTNSAFDRAWRYSQHSLELVGCYLEQYRESGQARDADRIVDVLNDWLRVNATLTPGDAEFSWEDHTTAIRLRRAVHLLVELYADNVLSPRGLRDILRFVDVHKTILIEAEQVQVRRHNHALNQAYSLLLAGAAAPFLQQTRPPLELSREILEGESSFLLGADGVQTENSPSYHMWVPPRIFTMWRMLSDLTDSNLPEDIIRRETASVRFATWIARPDGTLPQIGDTHPGTVMRYHIPGYEGTLEASELQFVKSKGQSGASPKRGTVFFPASGYVIYRDAWNPTRRSTDTQVIFKCGFLANGHRQDDDGQLLITAFGSDWLVDAGIFGYQEKTKERRHVRSAMAHNITSVVGAPPVRSVDSPVYARFGDVWGASRRSADHYRCNSFMQRGYRSTRDIRFLGNRIEVEDAVVSMGDHGSELLVSNFLVAPDKKVSINQDEMLATICDEVGRCLNIRAIAGAISGLQVADGMDDLGLSVITTKYLEVKPSRTIRYLSKISGAPLKFELWFTPALSFTSLQDPYGPPPD